MDQELQQLHGASLHGVNMSHVDFAAGNVLKFASGLFDGDPSLLYVKNLYMYHRLRQRRVRSAQLVLRAPAGRAGAGVRRFRPPRLGRGILASNIN